MLPNPLTQHGSFFLAAANGNSLGLEGGYSRIGESISNHPFQWGSKRTGPDLAREGGFRSDAWHYNYMVNPRSTSDGSIMPVYDWMLDKKTDIKALPGKIVALTKLAVPYEAMTKDVIMDKA